MGVWLMVVLPLHILIATHMLPACLWCVCCKSRRVRCPPLPNSRAGAAAGGQSTCRARRSHEEDRRRAAEEAGRGLLQDVLVSTAHDDCSRTLSGQRERDTRARDHRTTTNGSTSYGNVLDMTIQCSRDRCKSFFCLNSSSECCCSLEAALELALRSNGLDSWIMNSEKVLNVFFCVQLDMRKRLRLCD